MNKIATIALAAAMSATSLGGIAYAQTTGSTTPVMSDDMVNIVYIKADSDSQSGNVQIPETYRNPTEDMMMKAKTAVEADAALQAALVKQNVELQNVVAIETAANGGKIVYVK